MELWNDKNDIIYVVKNFSIKLNIASKFFYWFIKN